MPYLSWVEAHHPRADRVHGDRVEPGDNDPQLLRGPYNGAVPLHGRDAVDHYEVVPHDLREVWEYLI